eukprot:12898341-Prorocentrum_lima.AAC.1
MCSKVPETARHSPELKQTGTFFVATCQADNAFAAFISAPRELRTCTWCRRLHNICPQHAGPFLACLRIQPLPPHVD